MSTHLIQEGTAPANTARENMTLPAQAPNPPPREAAWENEGGAEARRPSKSKASAYADLLASYEGERQGRDDLLLRRMAAVRAPS